jgi:outer membrane protein assembly factor BamD
LSLMERVTRKHTHTSIAKWAFVLVLMISLFGGCALWGRFFGEEEEKSPEELIRDGMRSFEQGRYESATESFEKLKDRYPYSKYAVLAELRMADALYRRKLYDEAFEAYSEFERLHPKHPEIPYVIYQRGMCHFSQVTTSDRDQSHTQQAKEEFERLVKRFPRHEYADRARKAIRKCYIMLADYELYVAHFYFKKKKYRAALDRYLYIFENYPDLGQYRIALDYIGRCRERLGEEEASLK